MGPDKQGTRETNYNNLSQEPIQTCCTPSKPNQTTAHAHHNHADPKETFIRGTLSLIFLLVGLYFMYVNTPSWFTGTYKLAYFILAYIPVGLPVLQEAVHEIMHGSFFSEFFLMGIATLGAFAIGEYPEAVAVMLFYNIGEGFQSLALSRGHKNIQKLLDQRPDEITVIRRKEKHRIKAKAAKIGDRIQLKPGERLALDGELLSASAFFDTRALTGESTPERKTKGETILAGMINLNSPSEIRVTKAYQDSKLSQILKLVGEASAQKAPTELFIQKFAKIYTPFVVFAAIGITFLPYLFTATYDFQEWFYRALIFLVVSCPCALVISIPLGYFGGIGAASKNGILVKGGNYLDVLANLDRLLLDKTGTLTKGVFTVQETAFTSQTDVNEVLALVNTLESHSNHPIASAIHQYVGPINPHLELKEITELPGFGLKAIYQDKTLLVGNFRLLDTYQIPYTSLFKDRPETIIAVAYGGEFIGQLLISDELKPEAKNSINALHNLQVKTGILSGDKASIVTKVAKEVGVDTVHAELLPGDKVNKVKEFKKTGDRVGFVGDGLNDAPVIAISDVGIAMGGLGSDAAIEVADVVIQQDEVSRIPIAIKIGKKTKRIVWQNIGLAFGVKLIVLLLGALGMATMWEAVFADVGVALLAILNAVRIQRMTF